MAATSAWPWIRHASLRRRIEAALLAVALATVAVAIFAGSTHHPSPIPGLPHTPVALFLPIVLWAAVRLGPGGVSSSMLITTLVLTWAVTHGRGPFAALSPTESVLSLQLYLSVSIVPLMCLAGLIEERRRVVRALADRLSFEEFVARLSGGFVHLPSDKMDEAFDVWLERIGKFLALDRVLLLRIAEDGHILHVAHSWDAPGLGPMPRINVSAEFPWTVALLLREEPMVFEGLADVPAEAVRDLDSLRRYGVRSKLVLPLLAGHRVYGGLAFVMTRAERSWRAEFIASMKLIAEVFANALAQKGERGRAPGERADEVGDPQLAEQRGRGPGSTGTHRRRQSVLAPVRGRSGRAETRAGSRGELSRRVARGGRPR